MEPLSVGFFVGALLVWTTERVLCIPSGWIVIGLGCALLLQLAGWG